MDDLEKQERLHRMKIQKLEARREFLVSVGPSLAILLAWTFFLVYRIILEYVHTLGV